MIFNSIIFLNCTVKLLFYTLLIFKIPLSNSLRIGITPISLTYINPPGYLKKYNVAESSEFQIGRSFRVYGSKVDDILENLKTLTLLETAELVKKIEETFGVTAQAFPPGTLAPRPQSLAPEEPYKDEEEDEDQKAKELDRKKTHTVVIKEIQKESRISAFRVLKEYYPDKSAVEIKKLMDMLPLNVQTFNSKRQADELVKKLSVEGMKIEVD